MEIDPLFNSPAPSFLRHHCDQILSFSLNRYAPLIAHRKMTGKSISALPESHNKTMFPCKG